MIENQPGTETIIAPDARVELTELSNRLQSETAIRLLRMHKTYNSDLDEALTDFRGRMEIFAGILPPDDESVIAFIGLIYEMGAGGIKAAEGVGDIADALSRQVDHLEGYMLHRGMIGDEAQAELDKLSEQLRKRFGEDS